MNALARTMKLTVICMMLIQASQAQNIAGVIYDRDSLNMMPNVQVMNTTTAATAVSNSLGAYLIDGKEGDTLVFTHEGYIPQKEIIQAANKDRLKAVLMKRPSYRLSEVEIVSDERIKDSVNQRIIYKKTIKDAETKPKVHMGSGTEHGLFIDGPITALARKISGKGKKDKGFVRELTRDEQEQYIRTRYNAAKVKLLMNVDDSTANLFVERNPMPYDFARTAKELEIKMWIRERFRKWNNSPSPAKP